MEVKGVAFIARRALVERLHGLEVFDGIVREVAKKDAVFRTPILATTRIPFDAFLRLNQALVDKLYAGEPKANFKLGELSAEWAFNGPYKHIVTDKNVDEFAASAPNLYRNYFDEGEAKATRDGDEIHLELLGIPAPCRCHYIEYGIMGYFRRGLEMVTGATPKMTALQGFSKGDPIVHYAFVIGAG
jgi:hypothetical protein